MRCGICLSLFDANENLVEPSKYNETKIAPDDKLKESEPPLAVSESQTKSLSEPYRDSTYNPAPTNPEPLNQKTPNQETPNQEDQREDKTLFSQAIITPHSQSNKLRAKNIAMFALVIIAILAPLIQVLFYNSAQLSLNQRYRPTLEILCNWLTCPIAEWQNLDLIQSEALVIQKHPTMEDALQVDIVITNMADFPQRFPGLHLQFENLHGKIVTQRTFRPEQYRSGALANIAAMTPHQAYQITLNLVAPDSTAVSYSLTITN